MKQYGVKRLKAYINFRNSLLAILLLLSLSCVDKRNDKLLIVTSIAPQAQIIKELVDTSKVDVKYLLPAGLSPGSFSLRPSEVMLVSKADIYIRNYVPFEIASWENILATNSDLKVVSVVKSILKESSEMCDHDHAAHSVAPKDEDHDEENEHDEHEDHSTCEGHEHHTKHEERDEHKDHDHLKEHVENDDHEAEQGFDPHYWLSLTKNSEFVEKISEVLIDLKVSDAAMIKKNSAHLQNKLKEKHLFWKTKFSEVSKRSFVIYHPNLSYVSEDYNLIQYPLEVDGKSLTTKVMKDVLKKMKDDSITTLFFQKEFDVSQSASIARTVNAKTVSINTLDGEFLEMIDTLYTKLHNSLK